MFAIVVRNVFLEFILSKIWISIEFCFKSFLWRCDFIVFVWYSSLFSIIIELVILLWSYIIVYCQNYIYNSLTIKYVYTKCVIVVKIIVFVCSFSTIPRISSFYNDPILLSIVKFIVMQYIYNSVSVDNM